ncbi:LysR family transcriptional regulator [Brevibacillus fulvus]|uniref:DNA-binding transcriptional LysR family regulator n=1 Tax=Brevibacillus fulvus TaxID=1125967 RepID=A0A938Y1K7_9BACL|nr:LysR family transcriptional regulator [Brevibacillus fulvus]MBM7591635.1 DNA-binding transcriptional LysR family regulator [Brevibacillus fulvus]
MDLKELTAFKTILQEGTFTRAAEKLNYAQSTVTNQIKRLERELGVPLFKRGWDAELTESGQVLAEEIDHLLKHWQYVVERAQALQRDDIGSVRVGAAEPLMIDVLPNSMRRFQAQKPKISCHFVIANTDVLARSLLDNQLDFAFCGEPADPSPFYFERLYEERIFFVIDQDHPLRDKTVIRFEELFAYPLIVGGHTCLYHLRFAKQLARYSQTPFIHTVSQISAIPHFVKQSDAIGVVLHSTPVLPGTIRIAAEMDDPSISVGLLQLRNNEFLSTYKQLFIQLLKEEISAAGLLE